MFIVVYCILPHFWSNVGSVHPTLRLLIWFHGLLPASGAAASPGWLDGGIICWKISVKKFEMLLTLKRPLARAFCIFGEYLAASLIMSCVVPEFMVMLEMLLESTTVDPSDTIPIVS